MDHDIAAEIGSAITAAVLFVEVVWIIDAKSKMETAVGIEGLDFVQAFGDLAITLLQFWAGCPTRGENGIGFEKTEIV